MTTTNVYENLYTNVKERLTIVNGSNEYSLGEYMLMQAKKEDLETSEEPKLPVVAKNYAEVGEKALAMVVSYVNDKLTIKEPPVKDKTIRAFPFRASASALLSAVACCALVLSIGIVGMNSLKNNADGISMTDYYIEDATEVHFDIV
jgi:hypothetical protein